MKAWNLLITINPGPRHEYELLCDLNERGDFEATSFRDVCVGKVADVTGFLEDVRTARLAEEAWVRHLARCVPIDRVFHFTPETLATQLKEAMTPYLARVGAGAFYLRLERRGMASQLHSREIEREVADHLFSVAQTRGIALKASFEDPAFVLAAETVGNDCGIAFLPRELFQKYPFVLPH